MEIIKDEPSARPQPITSSAPFLQSTPSTMPSKTDETKEEMISIGTCDHCGSFGQWVPDEHLGQRLRPVPSEGEAAFQDDLASIMEALGIPTHARNASPHQVVLDEILPAIRRLTQ
jgi:hypothetical protein